jgi:drug/metabolite transporter (DMT)-like permease
MFKQLSPHTRAVLQALLVTFLWSTSWILIKFGLAEEIPALTFAGLRYSIAFLCLLPLVLRSRENLTAVRQLRRTDIVRLVALGLIYYTVTQGSQFVSLGYLPAATVNLLLGFTSVVVAAMGLLLLGEKPSRAQWGGLLLYITGAVVFFYPIAFSQTEFVGVVVALIGVFANAVSSVLGRSVNRAHVLSPIMITTITMGIGGIILLVVGLLTQRLPPLSFASVALIIWLAVVNTAFAFTLWNVTLKTLSALESSILNNVMMIEIPLLAWIFLGEALTWQTGVGLLLAAFGILVVQLGRIPLLAFRRSLPADIQEINQES